LRKHETFYILALTVNHSLFRRRVVLLSGVVGVFSLARDRQILSRAPDMAIRREQSDRGGTPQSNKTL